jgi:hypothetical protein
LKAGITKENSGVVIFDWGQGEKGQTFLGLSKTKKKRRDPEFIWKLRLQLN